MRIPEKKKELVKQKMMKECQSCEGKGCPSCTKKSQMIESLADANIPVVYWFLKMKDFKGPKNLKDKTIEYITKIEERYMSGNGLCLVGTYGTGKTTAACAVLKNALIKGYTAYYTTLNDLISGLTDYSTKTEFYWTVTKADFLCIDEVDSRHFSDSDEAHAMFGSNFERVIRYRTQNNLPIIVASNNASIEEVFTGQWRRVVDSLLDSSEVVPALGKDVRKK